MDGSTGSRRFRAEAGLCGFGIGKGGTVTITVDDKKVAEGRIDKVVLEVKEE